MQTNHLIVEVARDEHFKTPFLKELKENWPSLAKDYRHYCHQVNPKKGDMWMWTSPEGQKFFHLIVEDEEGQKQTETERFHFFRLAFKKVKKVLETEKIEKLTVAPQALHFKTQEFEGVKKVINEVLEGAKVNISYN